ncbi:MAG: glycosyltransferase family 4 protein [Candidatus Aenigmatarchaeota archaeon]
MKPILTLFMSSVGTTYGGSESYTINIAKHLCHDFNVKLILGRGKFTDDFISLINNYPVEFLSVPFISRHSRLLTYWRKTKFCKKINDFDIESLSVMASFKKIKKFLSGTDIFEVQYPVESLIFPFIDKHIKKVIHFHGYGIPPIFNFFNKRICHFIDSSITNSYMSKSLIEAKTKIRDIKVIYNGVDTDIFKPMYNNTINIKEYFNPDLPKVGTVGRLSKEKGINILIRVAKDMDDIAEFFALGPYDEDILYETKRLKVKNFHLIGPLPNKLLPFFYNFIDCYVLPSLFEAFGITVIEAMSCGKPVIASNVGGIPEIIDDGINGVLIEPDDHLSLKKALLYILKNREIQIRYGESGRQKVLENFSFKHTVDELKKFYFSLLN